jgi:5-dehydro-2-deoxygluconokinase
LTRHGNSDFIIGKGETSARESSVSVVDVITIGRASVDLYGQQIGTRLEDVGSFAKSVGGCPANIAIGTARLGLRSALITRVGGEQMGSFIKEQLTREGVVTEGVHTDPERLTALVLLSVEGDGVSPMIFYRTDCADMALDESDIDPDFIRSARAIVVTGTHFSRPNSAAAQHKAIRIAREHGMRVAFDIDYRPNLWGLAGHEAGFSRYVQSERVSEAYRAVLPDCDLVVGTEEEVLIASGEQDLSAALRAIRALTAATIVLKRGAMGCIVYDGAIPANLEDGIVGDGFPIEVYNVLGAGDAFMSGFLRGWLREEAFATCATWANACGAFAVSRLMCAPEYPSWAELSAFLEHGSPHRALRKDAALNHLHWATNRRCAIPSLVALAIDHRSQLEEMARDDPERIARIPRFKQLALEAAKSVAAERDGFGMLLDDKYGRDALMDTARTGLWIGRPVELPGSRPLRFEFSQDLGSRLLEWPVDHCVKVLCFYHPDDPEALRAEQRATLRQAYDAARGVGRDLMVEIIAGKHGALEDDTIARVLAELYADGVWPDWWKLEAQPSAHAWSLIEVLIEQEDPLCRGIVLLGLDAPEAQLVEAFALARSCGMVKGFAVGRTIFGDAARRWLGGEIDDDAAIKDMSERFRRLVDIWHRDRAEETRP